MGVWNREREQKKIIADVSKRNSISAVQHYQA